MVSENYEELGGRTRNEKPETARSAVRYYL